jgi:hypothetical protein
MLHILIPNYARLAVRGVRWSIDKYKEMRNAKWSIREYRRRHAAFAARRTPHIPFRRTPRKGQFA